MDEENEIACSAFSTRCVHTGQDQGYCTQSLIPPLYMTSTFVLDATACEDMAAGRPAKSNQYTYGRMGNPTQQVFEAKVASLEGAEAALATASGIAAISLTLLHMLRPGDHLLMWEHVYGHTYDFAANYLTRMGISVSFVESLSPEDLEKVVQPNTRVIYAETLSNPMMHIPDLTGLAEWAKRHGIATIIDNTLASPALCNPHKFGIDIVVHSATKYINGHGDALGGVITGSRSFINELRTGWYKYLGPVPNPMACWLFNRGLKSLMPRMERHSANAAQIAAKLAAHPAVDEVFYPGLAGSTDREMASRYLSLMPGILSFTVHGGCQEAKQVMLATKIARVALSLGDADTLISHPASMTHRCLPALARQRLGITDNLLRLSVGLEDATDLIADLYQALESLPSQNRGFTKEPNAG